MTTYAELDTQLQGRNAERRKIGNNTYAERRDGGSIAVRLHATDVLTFHKDGRVVLNTGGWRTVTTKDRINTFLPAGWRVYSERSVWHLYKSGVAVATYADGIAISKRGAVTGAGPKDAAKQDKELRARVAAYAIGFLTALDNGDVPAPSAGDCFYCAMREIKTRVPLGEVTRNADHIKQHMEESYYVPSLLVRALETFGASQVCRAWVHGKMTGDASVSSAWFTEVGREQAEKMLRRYVLRQLGGVA